MYIQYFFQIILLPAVPLLLFLLSLLLLLVQGALAGPHGRNRGAADPRNLPLPAQPPESPPAARNLVERFRSDADQ